MRQSDQVIGEVHGHACRDWKYRPGSLPKKEAEKEALELQSVPLSGVCY